MDLPDSIAQIFDNISHICVLTGAGISAESGVPTFRGQDGLWSTYRPEELANEEAFRANPKLVWAWYQHRRELIAKVRPNPGHIALARWEAIVPDFTLVTQNVDGLHRSAGSRTCLELHGNIRVNRCFDCGTESDMDEITFTGDLPRCKCGGLLRPGVVWFGEALPEAAMDQAFEAAQSCDLCLAVGTSAVVYPAASLPGIALESGAAVIEINTQETPFTSRATLHLRGSAAQLLPDLVTLYERIHPELTVTAGKP
jgi:NAD-dependent deacetylase